MLKLPHSLICKEPNEDYDPYKPPPKRPTRQPCLNCKLSPHKLSMT